MRQKLLALTALAAAGVGAAGCGGSSSSSSGSSNSGLSYSAFSDAANKVCISSSAAEKRVSAAHPTTLPAVAAELSKLVDVITTEISQLQALQGPSALSAARDTYVADLQQEEGYAKSAAAAAKANSTSGLQSALASVKALKPKGEADGSKLGAKACVKNS